MTLMYNPLAVFLPLGFVLLVLGSAKLGYDIVDKDGRVASNTLLIFFASFQVFAIGLLADLIGRVARLRSEVDPATR